MCLAALPGNRPKSASFAFFCLFFAQLRRVRRAPGKSRKRRKRAFFLRYPQICLNPHLLNPHLRHSKVFGLFFSAKLRVASSFLGTNLEPQRWQSSSLYTARSEEQAAPLSTPPRQQSVWKLLPLPRGSLLLLKLLSLKLLRGAAFLKLLRSSCASSVCKAVRSVVEAVL